MTREEAELILTEAVFNKKFMSKAYLTATYSETQLNRLLDVGTLTIMHFEQAIVDKRTTEFQLTEFQAYAIKTFLESQLMFVAQAYKWIQSNKEFTTIEGNCFDFELCPN